MAKKKKEPSFEELIDTVKEAAQKLESSDVGLEDAISVYEDGMKSLKACYERLQAAEKKVRVLLENADGSVSEKDFEHHRDEE